MASGMQKNIIILEMQTEEAMTVGFPKKSGLYLELEKRPIIYILAKHLSTLSPVPENLRKTEIYRTMAYYIWRKKFQWII